LVTVGILAAVYFFIVKPATDTATTRSTPSPSRYSRQRSRLRWPAELQHGASSANGSQSDLNQLNSFSAALEGPPGVNAGALHQALRA